MPRVGAHPSAPHSGDSGKTGLCFRIPLPPPIAYPRSQTAAAAETDGQKFPVADFASSERRETLRDLPFLAAPRTQEITVGE
jgi:hypothetical protein